MNVPIEFIAFVGIIIGVIGKTAIPYIRKIYEDPTISFNWGYFGTMCMSGIIAAVVVYPTFVIPEGDPWIIFIAAIFFAAGINGLINFIGKNKIQK